VGGGELNQGVFLYRNSLAGPIVEDDTSLDDHMNRVKKEGVWAGHMELQVGLCAVLLLCCAVQLLCGQM
jgi:hypothetical protein